jgi:hypothetical protein
MGVKRRRIKQTTSLEHRLVRFAELMMSKLTAKPIGTEKNKFLKKARNPEQALEIERELRQSQ